MGPFKPKPEPDRDRSLSSQEYDAAGARYLAYLQSGFSASLQADLRDDGNAEFFPLHLAASFAAGHATTALLHYVPESYPEQPFFTRPEAVDQAKVETVLTRMRWAMTYMLPDQMDTDEELIRAAMEESATFFARDEDERSDVLVLVNSDLLSEDTPENTLEQATRAMITGRPYAPMTGPARKTAHLVAFVTQPLNPPSTDFHGDSIKAAASYPFVVERFNDGLEAGFMMLNTIQAEGWQAVLDELGEELAD
jgi:hypothetical protein